MITPEHNRQKIKDILCGLMDLVRREQGGGVIGNVPILTPTQAEDMIFKMIYPNHPHCVQCGKQNIESNSAWYTIRCKECWLAFKKAGGIRRTESVAESPSGMRVANIKFSGQAAFCRDCGGKIDQGSRRVRHALLRGSECLTCDTCAANKRFPSSHEG